MSPSSMLSHAPQRAQSQRRSRQTQRARSAGNPPPRPRTLPAVFAATVALGPNAPALDASDRSLSYVELQRAASALASRLAALGIGPGDRVGVRVESGTADLYIAILGVLEAGAAYVPVDHDDPESRAHEIWQRSGACAVIGAELEITELASSQGRPGPPAPEDDAWVIFTSGSTGAPKGVAVSHASAVAFVDAETELWTIDGGDRVMAGLSVSFDASCEEIWLAWRNGAALVPAPRGLVRSGSELGPWITAQGITVVSTVPSLAGVWDAGAIRSVRLMILGGEACPEQLGWSLAAGRELWNTYGPTEATVVSTAAPIRPGEPIVIGRPLAGWKVAVIAADGSVAVPGEEGELVIGGVGLGRYIDPVLDAERYATLEELGWERAYRTGDMVRETASGLAFLGRRDEQVKIAGRRIELGELDARLLEAPGVTGALSAVRSTESGNKLLVGYVTGDVDPAALREWIAARLPAGLVPLVVKLDRLPRGTSGKLDRKKLPWPPPTPTQAATSSEALGSELERWLADLWAAQLGPVPIDPDSDFFALGGSSLAAAKLASVIRERFPAVAVADIYEFRTLRAQAQRLGEFATATRSEVADGPRRRRSFAPRQLVGLVALLVMTAPPWVIGILAFDRLAGNWASVSWGWLIVAWVLLCSLPGRVGIVVIARALLLRNLRPGRYPRRGSLASRVWFVERLSERSHVEALAGTPWAVRWARWLGHEIGDGARLGTIPPPSSIVAIGAGATLEGQVDLHGWWVEGDEMVIGEVRVGPGASIGTRTVLMPGSEVQAGAEVDPGSVIDGSVPAGERWAGVPAVRIGVAGEGWPEQLAPLRRDPLRWRMAFGAGLTLSTLVPLLAAAPGLVLLFAWQPRGGGFAALSAEMLLLALCFDVTLAVLTALAMRALAPLIRPGTYRDQTRTGWALWLTGTIFADSQGMLFPLYASVYTRAWLRLAGIRVGHRTEVSTAVGLSHLTSFAQASFTADDVVLANTRSRGGWMRVTEIEIGSRSFLGNGAIIPAGTRVGDDSLVGVLTVAPVDGPDGSSWLGAPAIELPRRRMQVDAARTVHPSRRLVAGRTVMDTIRILLPSTISVMIAAGVFDGLDAVRAHFGIVIMALFAPVALALAGIAAALVTAAIKWGLMGRYRACEHPLWSFFVWRDEIVNSSQEQLAGTWLLGMALGSPIMSIYLRLLGAKVGRDVWCETTTVSEHDLAELGDGAAVNRNSVVETHLFHDRVMQLGPAVLGAGSTLGPAAAMLPDTALGDGVSVGARAIVMRGERLPAGTRWHGAPVVAAP
jgi:non-ribosomal peptide synthetase-like protein